MSSLHMRRYCSGTSNIWATKLWSLPPKAWRIRCVAALCSSTSSPVVTTLLSSCVCCFSLLWCWRKFATKLTACSLLSRSHNPSVARIRNLSWGCKWWCVMTGFAVRYGGVLYILGGTIGPPYTCVRTWEWVTLSHLYWISPKDRSGWSCPNRRLFFMTKCSSPGCSDRNLCTSSGFCVVWSMDRGVASQEPSALMLPRTALQSPKRKN